MGTGPGIFILVAAGIVAALLLLALRNVLPAALIAALAVLAVAAGYAIDPDSVPWGLTGPLDLVTVAGMRLDGDSAGLLSMVIFGPATMLTKPSFGLGMLDPSLQSNFWIARLDAVWWSLLQMLAIGGVMSSIPTLRWGVMSSIPPLRWGVMSSIPPLRWPAAVARCGRPFAGPWPRGRRAALSTILAALLLVAHWLLVELHVYVGWIDLLVQAAAVAAVLVLRVRRPDLISWGAWIITMGVLVQTAWWALLSLLWFIFHESLGDVHTDSYYQAGLAVAAAALLLMGPRPEPAALSPACNRIGWAFYTLLVILPGIGFVCFGFLHWTHPGE
jgi:hypothetical protein